MTDSDRPEQCDVVVNNEEQYSLWPEGKPPPLGWRRVEITGTEDYCCAAIERLWTDMRPRSLRRRLDDEPVGNGS